MKTYTNAMKLAALLLAATALPCGAAEIRVLSAAVMQTVFKDVAHDFERASGHKLTFVYDTMGAITTRVLGGETADVIIGSTPSLARLVKEGKVDATTTLAIARVGVGVVVPTGTPKPAIASADELKSALLAAKIVVYADPAGGAAAGIHVGQVIERFGIAADLAPKTRFGRGGDITEVTLAQGPGALGLTQISEMVGKPGAEFVGPLPEALQNYTGITAGIPAHVTQVDAANALIRFLQGAAARSSMKALGMDPVGGE